MSRTKRHKYEKMILRGFKNAGVLEVLHERIGRRPAVYVFPQLTAISEVVGVVSRP